MRFETVQVKIRRRPRLWMFGELPHLLNGSCARTLFGANVGGVKIFCEALDFKKNVFIFQIREGKQRIKP